mgnify:CR=1 FL=1
MDCVEKTEYRLMRQSFTESNTFSGLKANTNYSITVKVSSTDDNVQPKEVQTSFVTGDLSKWKLDKKQWKYAWNAMNSSLST